jgi:hypothetical protein
MHMVCTHRRGEKHAAEVLNNGRSARSIVLRSGYSLAGYSVVLLRSVCSEPVSSCFTMITNNFITFKRWKSISRAIIQNLEATCYAHHNTQALLSTP